jgi:phage/plasmid-associated DNA primase
VGDPDALHVNSNLLYDRYTVWCKRNGEKALSQNKLTEALRNKGYVKKQFKADGSRNNWFGISLGPEISENGESASTKGTGSNGVHDGNSEPDLRRFDF